MNMRSLLATITGFLSGAAWGAFVAYLGGQSIGTTAMGVCTTLGCIVGAIVCGGIAEKLEGRALIMRKFLSAVAAIAIVAFLAFCAFGYTLATSFGH